MINGIEEVAKFPPLKSVGIYSALRLIESTINACGGRYTSVLGAQQHDSLSTQIHEDLDSIHS
jgi:hypothetical protein